MSRTMHYFLISAILVVVLLAGCSLPGPGGADPGSPSGSPSRGGATISGPCANPLLPVVAGATWNYQMTGTTSDTFTRTINSVSGDGFVDQDTFASGIIRTGQWKCDSSGLIALDPVGGTSATVQRNSQITDFHTTAQSGVTLPASVAAGAAWTQALSIAGTMVMNGVSASATNDTNLACTASGTESVSVPAGSFEAMKVTCQNSINITVTAQGITVPVPAINFTTVSWYAPGVGWVRAVSSGGGLDTTVTLSSYTLP